MQRIRLLGLIGLVGALLVVPTRAAPTTPNTQIDVVLVVDNSGSMHKNDPKNLRISVARLFTGLMAQGDQVGVVSMGEAAANTNSSTRVVQSLAPISSSSVLFDDVLATIQPPEELANYTYIGDSLTLAAQTLENAAHYNKQRAVIILTDGLPTQLPEDVKKEQDAVQDAVTRFQKLGVKVFSISLRDVPGEKWLKETLSLPTNGRTYRAEAAEQLLDKYIEILTLLQDGRYVDKYNVIGNVETFLANVNPRQEIRQINFVFPAINGKPPVISNLLLPGAATSSVDKMSRLHDPNWSMWTARPEYVEERFNGEWRTTLQSDQATVPMHSVIKSDLRARLIEPIPQLKDDENAVRYYPAGRPLLLRTGALDTDERLKRRLDMFVQLVAPQERGGFKPVDDGAEVDLSPADGEMAAMYPDKMQKGDYQVKVSIAPGDSHVQLNKQYEIIVEPLPTMVAEIGPAGQVPVGEPVRFKVRWMLKDKPATMLREENVEAKDTQIIAAVLRGNTVEDPKADKLKVVATVPLTEQADGTWTGEYLPAESGSHTFAFTAHAKWKRDDGAPRRYTDYLAVKHDIQKQPLVEVRVTSLEANPRVNSLYDGIQQTIEYHSHSNKPVELKLAVKDVPGGKVYPETLQIGPGEMGNRTVTINSPDVLKSGSYQARIEITGPPEARLSIPETNVSFAINGFWARNRWLIIVLLLLLLLVFRGVRTRLADMIGRNVELLRYGGR